MLGTGRNTELNNVDNSRGLSSNIRFLGPQLEKCPMSKKEAEKKKITSVPKKIDPLEKVKNTRKIEDSIAGKRKLSYTVFFEAKFFFFIY